MVATNELWTAARALPFADLGFWELDGTDGADGMDGMDGTSCSPGTDESGAAPDGPDGADGVDGADGTSCSPGTDEPDGARERPASGALGWHDGT